MIQVGIRLKFPLTFDQSLKDCIENPTPDYSPSQIFKIT